MMKLSGLLEVFQNQKGYVTGVFKAWDSDEPNEKHKVVGKAYMDVRLPKDVQIKEGQTLTLDVKEGYLRVEHIVSNKVEFSKFVISVANCDVVRVYPEEKKAQKSSKKVTK